jgi:predicted dehydrogenase
MLESTVKRAIIIGLGSIGKTHLNEIISIFKDITIIDTDREVVKYLKTLKIQNTLHYFQNIKDLPNNFTYDIAIISNWGPDHFETISFLLNYKINNFIVEKPLTDSLFELKTIENMIHNRQINVHSHMQLRYSNFKKEILVDARELGLGNPIKILVHGGSKCVATIGIHYLDLAIDLFEEEPRSTFANYYDGAINPRDKNLAYLEGVGIWNFSKNRDLCINFSNSSYVSEEISVIFEFGRILITGGNVHYFGFENGFDVKTLARPRTKNANNLLKVEKAFTYPGELTGTRIMHERIMNKIPKNLSEDGITATFWMIGSLISSELKMKMTRTNIENVPSEIQKRKFRIS